MEENRENMAEAENGQVTEDKVQPDSEQAAEETVSEALQRLDNCHSISLIVLDKDGNFGAATNCDFPFVYGNDEESIKLYLARYENGKTVIKPIDASECDLD